MLRYLASSANLVGSSASSVPFFQRSCAGRDGDLAPDERADALEVSFERY